MHRLRERTLEQMLEQRRDDVQAEVDERMRKLRSEGAASPTRQTEPDTSEQDFQEDIELALIQMKSELVSKIKNALVRLQDGDYGTCAVCDEPIAEKRLRAMPFAVRCTSCEAAQETTERRERTGQRHSHLFLDA
jgi:DnaK suppressor protein